MRVVKAVIIGKGNVGRALIRQMSAARRALLRRGLDLRLCGLAGRQSAVFFDDGLPEAALQAVAAVSAPLETMPGGFVHAGWDDLHKRIRRLGAGGGSVVIVDVTAEDSAAAQATWLKNGWSVVTANKKPLTSSLGSYDAIMRASGPVDGPRYRYETTCGAGLPLIGVINDLLACGDRVLEISGAASGTLGFIFSACQEGAPFAQAVAEAKRLGYTEPDPRDDLSGADVARKALILARLIGLRPEMSDMEVESLVPPALKDVPLEEFMSGLPAASAPLDERFRRLSSAGKSLRYLLSVGPDGLPAAASAKAGVRVGIEEVEKGSGFGSLRGPENMFVIRTKRYDAMPLVIRGPGAGAEVTAAGIFSDILRIIGI